MMSIDCIIKEGLLIVIYAMCHYTYPKIERRMTMKKIEMKEVTLEKIEKPDKPVLGGVMARIPDILDKEFKKPGEVLRGLW
ncbi:hypothetical protein SAMN04487772_103107 [[Clostridium] polysaccharolyticum]|uniref:Uncharacterized protein n=1 Tax=[Clostridium] polysaccharolyticum TaxID=29364 RepID=A0A1H9ZCK7_9FIRM|nr:hypothetical protein SAMN04487772_103107 [[Clostridium] polysaccharolyticum]